MANEIKKKKIPEIEIFLSPIQRDILNVLEIHGPMTRSELVKELRTARTTIFDNLIKLQRSNRIEKFTRNNGMRGRPLVFWKLIL